MFHVERARFPGSGPAALRPRTLLSQAPDTLSGA
jgi:hypothetical protein